MMLRKVVGLMDMDTVMDKDMDLVMVMMAIWKKVGILIIKKRKVKKLNVL